MRVIQAKKNCSYNDPLTSVHMNETAVFTLIFYRPAISLVVHNPLIFIQFNFMQLVQQILSCR